ncbi:hypothetical protein GCK72_022834 [Caenorhabditis remanei]|uniref:Uncharacterized protein n=1 Tax=Caenorhabditis remanei TaxID=31234 RepID=A0A6A5FUS2_CAERE|nr:hypothetical protein GCK72_022834 [Caenorhabditis remanei]KAF1746380.1 hypothetical protein GCK72_022834 [Caenorhabditis remanei]
MSTVSSKQIICNLNRWSDLFCVFCYQRLTNIVLASKSLLLLDSFHVLALDLLKLGVYGTELASSSLQCHAELVDPHLEVFHLSLELLLGTLQEGNDVLSLLKVDVKNLGLGLKTRLNLLELTDLLGHTLDLFLILNLLLKHLLAEILDFLAVKSDTGVELALPLSNLPSDHVELVLSVETSKRFLIKRCRPIRAEIGLGGDAIEVTFRKYAQEPIFLPLEGNLTLSHI